MATATSDRQLPLFAEPSRAKPLTIQERFEAFHGSNPTVLALLRDKALTLKGRGFKRYGLKALFEALRYDMAVQTNGQPFKLDNGFTAHYARKLMEVEPRLKGFFETRGDK